MERDSLFNSFAAERSGFRFLWKPDGPAKTPERYIVIGQKWKHGETRRTCGNAGNRVISAKKFAELKGQVRAGFRGFQALWKSQLGCVPVFRQDTRLGKPETGGWWKPELGQLRKDRSGYELENRMKGE